MSAVKKPWVILLCRFSDDQNDPATTRVMDLAAQWRVQKSPAFVMANLGPFWDTDSRTILELYNAFFTITGIFTFNIVQYFDAMSRGLVDVSGNQVFPCKLNMTTAQGAALANNPGGSAYQNQIFKVAKAVLLQDYGAKWTDFFGVAVSFQSPDFGGQGGTFDGGPGVYADIRYVVDNGTQRWGHEMGHGFGLDHSRTDGQFTSSCTGGDPSDYTDPWDIMSINCAFSAPDNDYHLRGPGMNAWNMRHMQGLDEGRIWKASTTGDFSETITLNPLHERTRSGYLGAELPGIAGDSSYLVEFRVPEIWDSAVPQRQVIVHRFDGAHSYIMKGTKGQKNLLAGDIFEKGAGPRSKVRVLAIDAVNDYATIQLCYTSQPVVSPTAEVYFSRSAADQCPSSRPVADTVAKFAFKLSNVTCNLGYQVMWSVSGASPISSQQSTEATFSIVVPDSSVAVAVTVTVFFDDGSTVSDTCDFTPLDQSSASLQHFICTVLQERLKPIPWWEWDPEKFRNVASIQSKDDLRSLGQITTKILETIRRLSE